MKGLGFFGFLFWGIDVCVPVAVMFVIVAMIMGSPTTLPADAYPLDSP